MALLIETWRDETDEDFKKCLVELVADLHGERSESLDVGVGKRMEYKGRFFREFKCNLGAVYFTILMHATYCDRIGGRLSRTSKTRQLRAMIRIGRLKGQPSCYEIRDGRKEPIDCNQVREA